MARKKPFRSKSHLFTQIATDMSDADALLEKIQSQKRQKAQAISTAEFVAPRTPVEETIAGIWADLLGRERVGSKDNFFEIGGHSLLGTQVMSRVNESFNINLPLQALFEPPTVSGLAEHVERARQEAERLPAFPPLKPYQKEGHVPLSFSQQRLWFIQQLEPDNASYNISGAMQIDGDLDAGILEQSFQEVVRRHESLRTRFILENDRPVQDIMSEVELTMPLVELQDLPEDEQLHEVHRLATEEAQKLFDLTKCPLLRVTLLQQGPASFALLVTMHHIISDGWSLGVLIEEVMTLYNAFSKGFSSPLPELPVQYADFALWQQEWLQGEILEQQLAYWKQQLSGEIPVLELPTDRPRPSRQSSNGATHYFSFPQQLSEDLKRLSRQQGSTLFMTLLAAFKVLMFRYTGQEDILIGSPIANRHRSELESLIGMFVNTLIYRSDLSGEPLFSDLLAQVKQTALENYRHQDLPFEKLVDELQIERDLSHPPLFQAMFVLQNAPMQEIDISGLAVRPIEIETGTAMFDLLLSMTETGPQLEGSLEYNTDLFDAERIQRMLSHFQHLLESIAENPARSISELPMLSEQERHRMLVEWNDTTLEYPAGICLHHFFERQAERTPDAVAVLFADSDASETRLTYRELNQEANRLADRLQALGVQPDTRVGLCVERSIHMAVALLAILKAGGAYVPLDPSYPKERLGFMMSNAKMSVLLTQQHLQAQLPASGVQTICLDAEDFSSESTENPSCGITPEHLLYVIYTSGSTGTPKGVAMPHRPLANLIQWQLEHTGISGDAATLQFSPISFDVSCQEIFSTWSSGGTLVMLSEQTRSDPFALLRLLKEQRIARLFLPFVALQQLADAAEGMQQALPEDLREVVTAGEQLHITPSIARFFKALGNCKLYNQYGPSETHVATAFPVEGGPEDWTAFPPIGRPVANTRIYILDAHLQPVPVGVPGELLIGGACLARGYLDRQDLSDEKFIPNPFSVDRQDRLYRTGDVARYLSDGNIEFLGRIDAQVKIRGFRIEPGEVEAAILRCPGMKECVVLPREDHPGLKYLAAYIVSQPEEDLNVNALRALLAETLPEYMIPTAFVLLDALPLTPSGKINHRALPAPEMGAQGEEFVAPRTPAEELVADIWTGVLGTERIGIADNFFELGGHSLLATQVVSRLNKAFKSELSLQRFFEHPTVAGLVEGLIEQESKPGQVETIARLRKEIGQMSPEDVREMLRKKKKQD